MSGNLREIYEHILIYNRQVDVNQYGPDSNIYILKTMTVTFLLHPDGIDKRYYDV